MRTKSKPKARKVGRPLSSRHLTHPGGPEARWRAEHTVIGQAGLAVFGSGKCCGQCGKWEGDRSSRWPEPALCSKYRAWLRATSQRGEPPSVPASAHACGDFEDAEAPPTSGWETEPTEIRAGARPDAMSKTSENPEARNEEEITNMTNAF